MIDIAHVEELIVSNPTDVAKYLRYASVEEVNKISNLTPEQKAKINGINDTYRGMLKAHSEANAYRWQNYYDCIEGTVDGKSICDWCDDLEVCQLQDKGGKGCKEWVLRTRKEEAQDEQNGTGQKDKRDRADN